VTTLRDAPDAPASWPFAPIEELDLYLENAQEPSLVQLETHVRGHLDQAALAAALTGVLAADPAARRHVAATPRWSRRLRWEAAAPAAWPDGRPASGEPASVLTVTGWRSAGQLAALREQVSAWPMPLHSTAARVLLAVGPEHDVVIVQTHHAAFDGISSLALLGAICAAYRDRGGGGDPAPPVPPDPGVAHLPPPREQAPAARPAPRRLPGLVTRIAARAPQPDRAGYGFVLASVPVPRPDRRGSGPHPTVNDVIVAAMILTVDQWNAAHAGRDGITRICVPVNNRVPEQRWAGPGNMSRLIRVTARPGQRADPAGLLAQVAAQTRAAKEQPRAGLDGVSRLLAAGWAPTAVKQRAARLARRLCSPVFTDTTMVSNLGVLPDPPSFSGSGREPMWFYGPATMPRGLCLSAVTVAGRLNLCITHRPALLDSAAAAHFTASYCLTLAALAAPAGDRLP
jgi:NRPS condensation-like uncharacterized protein